MTSLEKIIADIVDSLAQELDRGIPASYIPPLASVSTAKFGIAIVAADGSVTVGGDADEPFSIQSISKVFALSLALGRTGDQLWQRVGREPSGSAFNSIVQLETERGIPRNPFINAGAIVVADALLSVGDPKDAIAEFISFMRMLTDDDDIFVDSSVATAEQTVGYRNIALANYMRSFGNLNNSVDRTLGVYFHLCATAMSCRQLALAGRFLMRAGMNPETGRQIVSGSRAKRINALMLTCGHYDESGEFAFRVGLPGKSGVGGGILVIAPGVASIAVWSPGLNEKGNSKLGNRALEMLIQETGWSVFEAVSSEAMTDQL